MTCSQPVPGPHPSAMLPKTKVTGPELHSAGLSRWQQEPALKLTQLEHLKNEFQQRLLRDKEKKLESLFPDKRQNNFAKPRSFAYSAGSNPQNSGLHQPGPGREGFGSAGSHPRLAQPDSLKAQIPLNWTAKKQVGVDRAYPLKPMSHHQVASVSRGVASNSRTFSLKPSDPRDYSSPNPASRNCENSCPGNSPLVPLPPVPAQNFKPDPNRAELVEIRRLEATGELLQEEIRKKEALLRETLKRAEQELRRMQKGKEQEEEEEEEERRVPQRKGIPGRRTAGQRSTVFKSVYSLEDQPEEGLSNYVGTREDENWGRYPRHLSSLSGFSQFPSEYGVRRLKKERLGAGNGNRRDPTSSGSASPPQAPSGSFPNSSDGNGPQTSVFAARGCAAEEEPDLGRCSYCGRRFLLARLERHANACRKARRSKRKVFDSAKARAKGTDLEQFLTWKGPAPAKAEPSRKCTWRQKHDCFIQSLRQAREMQQGTGKGGKLLIPPAEHPDYVECPHCSRRFAPNAAQRHIPKCKNIKNRPPPPGKRSC
ncbi:zinc finger C2HC domain-containing protein 1C [Tachyglossus aculeatus]|uniref:zinc finger C2HC domain-containing protein 1C n=1 Tax=Tachyglossus aculeatus TaxID=9261 RepID=UPI0018F5A1B8|nr:zinc finger C2HC domain-containing protein 1C [Tachyglossus aculeatus]